MSETKSAFEVHYETVILTLLTYWEALALKIEFHVLALASKAACLTLVPKIIGFGLEMLPLGMWQTSYSHLMTYEYWQLLSYLILMDSRKCFVECEYFIFFNFRYGILIKVNTEHSKCFILLTELKWLNFALHIIFF